VKYPLLTSNLGLKTMARFQWQLIHTFTLPLDSAGQELWRVDFDANYFEDLAKLRKEYSKYLHETRGEIHEKIEFWVLLPTPETTPETDNLEAKEVLKNDLDNLYEVIENTLQDERFEAFPELIESLQKAHWKLQDIDL
jgi:hypothetical protein